ncbi:Uncharacterised protein [Mycobacteroides abscessus subsp. abscessus]|nr:Uncharacterised protein [Mycobacteroides abscessus subsp. abscessus]
MNITSEISDWPVAMAPIAPKMNMSEFPIKKAITVVMTADRFVLAKRAKSGVNVPALIKEPTQIVNAAASPIASAG